MHPGSSRFLLVQVKKRNECVVELRTNEHAVKERMTFLRRMDAHRWGNSISIALLDISYYEGE